MKSDQLLGERDQGILAVTVSIRETLKDDVSGVIVFHSSLPKKVFQLICSSMASPKKSQSPIFFRFFPPHEELCCSFRLQEPG